MKAIVIFHEEMGVYLGNALGLGFWSMLDPAGQTSAVCFPDEDAARDHAQSWEDQVTDLQLVAVEADEVCGQALYATPRACANAGLPAWQPDVAPAQPDDDIKGLFLIVKADIDPAAAWHSWIIAAVDESEALAIHELAEADVDHITKIGTAELFVETGIVLSQLD